MPAPDASGHKDRQTMDPAVLALVHQAERGIRQLLRDAHQSAGWDAQLRCLLELQAVAAILVNAARLHAEDLSRQAGQLDRPAGT